MALKCGGRWRLSERSTLLPLDIVRSVLRFAKLWLDLLAFSCLDSNFPNFSDISVKYEGE